MKLRLREASWFGSGLLLVALVSTGLQLVGAQPKTESSRPAFDTSETTFELLGEHKLVNISTITYTSDDGGVFDIHFACSSARGEDPLRFTDTKDITKARSYFNNEKRYGKHFRKIAKHCINVRHLAYIDFNDDSVVLNFNARIADAFVRLTLTGADAEGFRKTAGVAVQGRQQPAPEGARGQAKAAPAPIVGAGGAPLAVPDKAANRALASQQLALIDAALATMHGLARNARFSFGDPAFSLWEHRRLETLRRAGAGKAEIVAALEKSISSLQAEEAIAKTQHESARATQVPIYDVQFRRMEAEIWLNEEKAR